MHLSSLSFCAVLMVAACGPKIYPAVPAPEKTMPAVDLASMPPVPNQGQVVLDTADGPATVVEVLATETWSGQYTSAYGERTAPVCITPCIANLPYGPRTLRFSSRVDPERVSTESVVVTSNPTVHRYNIGRVRTHVGGMIGGMTIATLGGISAVTCLITGAVLGNGAVLGVGVASAAVMGGGIYWANASRSEITPGTMTSFPVSTAASR